MDDARALSGLKKAIRIGEYLKYRGLAERNGSLLLWVPEPSVAVAKTSGSKCRRWRVPFHPSVHTRIGISRFSCDDSARQGSRPNLAKCHLASMPGFVEDLAH